MARTHYKSAKKGWKSKSADGKLLKKLLKSGKIGPGMPPGAIKEQWPEFRKYKSDAFASAVRRMKCQLGLNCRKPPGQNTDDEEVSLGSKDTGGGDDDDGEDEELIVDTDDDSVEVMETTKPSASGTGTSSASRHSFAGMPASVSVSRPSFGDSLGSPSVARMPGAGQFEMAASRPVISSNWTPPYIKTWYPDCRQIRRQLVALLLPSGTATKDTHHIRLSIKLFGSDYYLCFEMEWPDTFDKDDGEIFLEKMRQLQLKYLKKKWMDLQTIDKTRKAEIDFERSHVIRTMAVKQAMIAYRNWKRTTQLRSETQIKLDFPVERLEGGINWWLLKDDKTGDGGVRMIVVDLAEASNEEEYVHNDFHAAEGIGEDDDDEY